MFQQDISPYVPKSVKWRKSKRTQAELNQLGLQKEKRTIERIPMADCRCPILAPWLVAFGDWASHYIETLGTAEDIRIDHDSG